MSDTGRLRRCLAAGLVLAVSAIAAPAAFGAGAFDPGAVVWNLGGGGALTAPTSDSPKFVPGLAGQFQFAPQSLATLPDGSILSVADYGPTAILDIHPDGQVSALAKLPGGQRIVDVVADPQGNVVTLSESGVLYRMAAGTSTWTKVARVMTDDSETAVGALQGLTILTDGTIVISGVPASKGLPIAREDDFAKVSPSGQIGPGLAAGQKADAASVAALPDGRWVFLSGASVKVVDAAGVATVYEPAPKGASAIATLPDGTLATVGAGLSHLVLGQAPVTVGTAPSRGDGFECCAMPAAALALVATDDPDSAQFSLAIDHPLAVLGDGSLLVGDFDPLSADLNGDVIRLIGPPGASGRFLANIATPPTLAAARTGVFDVATDGRTGTATVTGQLHMSGHPAVAVATKFTLGTPLDLGHAIPAGDGKLRLTLTASDGTRVSTSRLVFAATGLPLATATAVASDEAGDFDAGDCEGDPDCTTYDARSCSRVSTFSATCVWTENDGGPDFCIGRIKVGYSVTGYAEKATRGGCPPRRKHHKAKHHKAKHKR